MGHSSIIPSKTEDTRYNKVRNIVLNSMDTIVFILSVLLIVWISIDTFDKVDFLHNGLYMRFQFWVCMVFIADFVIEVAFAEDKWKKFRHRLVFLLLSIPYVNIISTMHLELSHDALYFIRFIPLARGALAMSIVIGYLSRNAVSSLLLSYLAIMLLMAYFCSLIFYQREYGLNPAVDTYWTALWWTAMNLTTVGCSISPVTVSGKIIAVALPITGMIMFPLFTVYLTDYVTRSNARGQKSQPPQSPQDPQP